MMLPMSKTAAISRGRAAGHSPHGQGGRGRRAAGGRRAGAGPQGGRGRAGAAGGRRGAAGAAGQGGRRAGAAGPGPQGRGRAAAGAGPVTLTAAEARAIASAFQWFAVNREGESAVALLGLLKRSFKKGK